MLGLLGGALLGSMLAKRKTKGSYIEGTPLGPYVEIGRRKPAERGGYSMFVKGRRPTRPPGPPKPRPQPRGTGGHYRKRRSGKRTSRRRRR